MRTILAALFLSACGSAPSGSPRSPATSGTETGQAPPVEDSAAPLDPRQPLQMAAPAQVHTSGMATPDVCGQCHENAESADAMRLLDGSPVGPYDLQHASVMANAGRDPLFYAVLAAESARVDAGPAEVEAVCFRCHAPAAVAESASTGAALVDAATLRAGEGAAATLGRDGVTCVSCHRMADDGLETPERWTGAFRVDESGSVFGPHADPFTHPMEMHTGWTPTQSDHIRDSRLCASCHTLQTHTVVDGAVSEATFLEQATWLEWRASAYAGDDGGASCQDCHMPTTEADGADVHTRIARRPNGTDFSQIEARSPYGLHSQLGGNTLLLSLLQDHRDILQPRASDDALSQALSATRSMLGTAAVVRVDEFARQEGGLQATISVENHTGHKLPTGYPARRAWLSVEVRDASGETVFAAGRTDDAGRVLDAAGAPLGSERVGGPAPAHVTTVGPDGQVPIYGVTMRDTDGQPTWRLLPAAAMGRDTRLLPRGWDASLAETEVGSLAPVGVDEDPDFLPGGDRVTLALPTLPGETPHTLHVALRYQPLSPRFAAELGVEALPEVTALGAMLDVTGLPTETLAEGSVEIP